MISEDTFYDASAEPDDIIALEISPEIGQEDKYKLYLHVNGVTVVRICKLHKSQILLHGLTVRTVK